MGNLRNKLESFGKQFISKVKNWRTKNDSDNHAKFWTPDAVSIPPSGMVMKKKIINECKRQGITLDTQIAYVLATALWETNHTLKLVREAYWVNNPEKWRKKNLYYYPYYGRGLPQLTHRKNYAKFGKLLGIDLVGNPDLALIPEHSIFILVYGMKHGSFTGKKLDDYIQWYNTSFSNARRIVNGNDEKVLIAKLATKVLKDLRSGKI